MGGEAPSNSREKNFVNDRLAALSREQWADYETRFMPVERQLQRQLGGASAFQDAQFARKEIPRAFDLQRDAMGRDLARLGVTMAPDQQQAVTQSLAMQRASALVGATNAARQHAQDRDLAVLSGGMAAMNRNIRGMGQQ